MDDKTEGTCPVCEQGDLISITMSVGGRQLAFTTCHLCEAKWWYRDGRAVPLQSVIGTVAPKD
jgi:formate dehydrogenase maturation protein FdhE